MSLQKSESIKEIAPALVKAMALIQPAKKDAQNPAFRSHYATLSSVMEACREALNKNNLCVLQTPSSDGPKVTVETIILHTSGEYISGAITMSAKDASPQAIGSATSYGRRYGLASLLGITTEDDDGEAAQPQRTPQPSGMAAAKELVAKAASAQKPAAQPAAEKPAPAGGFVLGFGKYKGRHISDAPDDYLTFLADSFTKGINDPAKERFKENNRLQLAQLLAEMDRRKMDIDASWLAEATPSTQGDDDQEAIPF